MALGVCNHIAQRARATPFPFPSLFSSQILFTGGGGGGRGVGGRVQSPLVLPSRALKLAGQRGYIALRLAATCQRENLLDTLIFKV